MFVKHINKYDDCPELRRVDAVDNVKELARLKDIKIREIKENELDQYSFT